MWQQILITALAAGALSAAWHGIKWLTAKSNRDEILVGIQAGRRAFFERFGTNSNLTDEAIHKAITVDEKIAQAAILEAEKQSRMRRRELGITGKEFHEVTVKNQVVKLCQIANEYTDVPDSLAVEDKWKVLQNLIVEPFYKGAYPDEASIIVAYQEWQQCLESLFSLTEKPKFAYLIGALEAASQEFLMQMCARAGQTPNKPQQDAWVMVLNVVKPQSLATKIRLRALF